MDLPNAIEAILFYQAEPLTIKRLSALLKRNETDIHEAILVLEGRLSATGLRLLSLGDEVAIGTAPDASALIEAISKEELSKDLSKASLETIAIVLYRSPITRAEIDYIRGVNSTFILRNLLIRGLVEKVDNPKDQRSFLYKPTFELLQYMGVTNISELPEYDETLKALETFVAVKESSPEEEKETSTQSEIGDSVPADSENGTAENFGIIPEPDELDEVLSLEDEISDDEDTDDLDILDSAVPSLGVVELSSDEEVGEDIAGVSPEVEADIAEEDEAGANFVDDALEEHLANDEKRI